MRGGACSDGPGDFTPPSRFVRAVAFSKAACPESRRIRVIDNEALNFGTKAVGSIPMSGAETLAEMTLAARQWVNGVTGPLGRSIARSRSRSLA
jgi:penicillin V acylase-like amidase (Ntn superfamily)